MEPFAAMNADPAVVEFLPAPLSRSESDAMVERIRTHFARHGFGLWAVEIPGVSEFAGFVGLSVPRFEAWFTPCVEVGWRLARGFWGQGYATEAGLASLDVAFEHLGLQEVVSFTVPPNERSIAVMERLGMRPAGRFDHPLLPAGHPLRPHVLYRITRAEHAGRAQAWPPVR